MKKMKNKLKTRIDKRNNYKGLYFDGRTLRIALDPSKPITELTYPEFYDVAITNKCYGNCPYCYKSGANNDKIVLGLTEKFKNYFGKLDKNQRPFQIAFAGGELFLHPEVFDIIKACYDMDIAPNYTTNGMWSYDSKDFQDKILQVTKEYCGGVAVSTHPHLKKYWVKATEMYLEQDIFTNLHVIISDKKSVDEFMEVYNKYHGKIKYFVLLPLSAQGRCTEAIMDWDYVVKTLPEECPDIAFGANFYPYLCSTPNRFKMSLYEPELMSKYLDIETMNIYPSSFSNKVIELDGLTWKVKS